MIVYTYTIMISNRSLTLMSPLVFEAWGLGGDRRLLMVLPVPRFLLFLHPLARYFGESTPAAATLVRLCSVDRDL